MAHIQLDLSPTMMHVELLHMKIADKNKVWQCAICCTMYCIAGNFGEQNAVVFMVEYSEYSEHEYFTHE